MSAAGAGAVLLQCAAAVHPAGEAHAPFVLVANLGQPETFEVASPPGHGRWQAFTTGAAEGGYRLDSVAVAHPGAGGAVFSVTVCATRPRVLETGFVCFDPVEPCTALAAPRSLSAAGTATFKAPPGTVLEAQTTYAVVVSGGGRRVVYGATSSGEDRGGAAGWRIDDFSVDGRARLAVSRVLRMAVAGSAIAPGAVPEAPADLRATRRGGRIELSWRAPERVGDSALVGYRIERSPDGSPSNWTVVADTGDAGTSHADRVGAGDADSVGTGTADHYRVSAVNASGAGPPVRARVAGDV